MYSTANIYNWARIALGASSTDVADGSLSMFATSAIAQLLVDYPCVTTGGSFSLIDAADVAAFEEAAGYRVALRFYRSPAMKMIAAKLLMVKVGPVTEEYGDKVGDSFVSDSRGEAARAMRRVACVAAGNPSVMPIFAVDGLRREQGTPSVANPNAILDLAFGQDTGDEGLLDGDITIVE